MSTRSEDLDKSKDDKDQLYELVEELTTSGETKLNDMPMKELKNLCKRSDENLGHVYRILSNQMEKEHAEIRLSCFQVINELFTRSHEFRKMVLDDFHSLLELCVETNDEKKLPPPANVAKMLKSIALSEIDNWYQKFGKHYKKLELGYDFLKRVKKVDFAGVRSRTLLQQQRQQALEAKKEELEKRAVEKVQREMQENGLDIESAIKQGNSCLNLVLPRPCDLYPAGENSEFQTQTVEISSDSTTATSSLEKSGAVGNYHGIPTNNYKLTIKLSIGKTSVMETDDNRDLLSAMHDLMNEIKNKFVPMVNKWINILTKCNNVNDKLEKCMQLKESLKELNEKYNEIEVTHQQVASSSKALDRSNDDDDDNEGDDDDDDDDTEIFEDVPELDAAFQTNSSTGHEEELYSKNLSEATAASDKLKAKDVSKNLKRIAPVVPFGNDLKYWGGKHLHITPITKNDSLHKFWSHSEINDDFVPDGLEASLRNRAIVFAGEFKRVKWKCRTPLANGKLCERQDRLKCPFHGKIIPRDEFGVACNPEDLAAENERKGKLAEEEADVIRKDIELATGKDLGYGKQQKKQSISKQRHSRLTNLKTVTNTSRKRLEKKVLCKGALQRVDEALNAIETRRNMEKFGSNFNYHYER